MQLVLFLIITLWSLLLIKINNNLKWQSLQHRRVSYDLALFDEIRSGLVNISFPEIAKSIFVLVDIFMFMLLPNV